MHDWQQLTTPYGDATINMEMISVLTKVFAGEKLTSMQISKELLNQGREGEEGEGGSNLFTHIHSNELQSMQYKKQKTQLLSQG